MEPAEIVAITVGVITVGSAILGGIVWLIRATLSMQREFKPNGGSSTRDALTRIENDVRDIRAKVDDHIDWHMDRR